MFFFKRKKVNSEKMAGSIKTPRPLLGTASKKVQKEISVAKPTIDSKTTEQGKGSVISSSKIKPPVKLGKSEETEQVFDDNSPVKVVIPASALEEESPAEDILKADLEKAGGTIPDEVVDSLLVEVKRDNRVEDNEVELPLEIIQPRTGRG